ncbi:hypothetical protein N1028_00010 [Herbiconiux sp. CPCC 203407]|uniref:Uncharacterized protein n=1 Tax=Herbiconiux oxytropis TaxID=2970915 RepID=A0AA41XD46_9MICO|nr:hypothetical protein [Herbiconiux oxytropis]MCS5720796.1 hypothetical protein [Herbiconiux oxytropis]MCS5724273.1 hypothetical protein [Herbiconiux oxytropis]
MSASKRPADSGDPSKRPKEGFWYRPLSKRATVILACVAGAIIVGALIATPLLGVSLF